MLPSQLLTLLSNISSGFFFGVELFADMNINNNFVLNKYTALQMRNHLKSKYNKLNPMHVKDIYTEFELPPTLGSPISLYFAKQNRCISILADTDEPVTDPKRLRTLLGHLQAIPAMQQPVDDYNKKVLSDGAMSWNDTQKFFIKEDLKVTDNFQALSQAGIGSAHNAVTDERIDQLQSHTSTLIERNATYDKAMTDLALVVNSIQEKQAPAPAPTPSAPSN